MREIVTLEDNQDVICVDYLAIVLKIVRGKKAQDGREKGMQKIQEVELARN